MKYIVAVCATLMLFGCASGLSEADIARLKAEQAKAAEAQRQQELNADFDNIQQQAKQASKKVSN